MSGAKRLKQALIDNGFPVTLRIVEGTEHQPHSDVGGQAAMDFLHNQLD